MGIAGAPAIYETGAAIAEKIDALLFAGRFTMEFHHDGIRRPQAAVPSLR
jgi:hypothetical protein